MANKYFTSDVIKLKRKCKATRVAMYGAVFAWLSVFCVGWALFAERMYDAGGATPFMEAVLIVSTFVAAAVALFIALLICFPFHNKIERHHAELRVKLNCF